jgi:hypothetical protein
MSCFRLFLGGYKRKYLKYTIKSIGLAKQRNMNIINYFKHIEFVSNIELQIAT